MSATLAHRGGEVRARSRLRRAGQVFHRCPAGLDPMISSIFPVWYTMSGSPAYLFVVDAAIVDIFNTSFDLRRGLESQPSQVSLH